MLEESFNNLFGSDSVIFDISFSISRKEMWEKNIPVQQTSKISQIKKFPLGKDNSVGLGIILTS